MVVSGMVTFLKYHHRTLQQVLSQSHFPWRYNQSAMTPKNLMQIPHVGIKQVKKTNYEAKINSRIVNNTLLLMLPTCIFMKPYL